MQFSSFKIINENWESEAQQYYFGITEKLVSDIFKKKICSLTKKKEKKIRRKDPLILSSNVLM